LGSGAAPKSVSIQPLPLVDRSGWGAQLASGGFAISVEILPPAGCQPDRLLEQAKALRAGGVHAVSIPDGARAQGRMSAIASGIVIQRDAGVEALVHYSCRDRSMLGMVSDLLGAAAAGIRNLLIITGDPPGVGWVPDATSVPDIDSIGLTNIVQRLNHGLDPGEHSIGHPTRFVIGVAVNPWASDLEQELRRFQWKVEAGAEFAVTQPVFDVAGLESFLRRIEKTPIPIIAGIWPLVSVRQTEFLGNEVPGIHVPASVQARMRAAEEKGDAAARDEGVAIAREIRNAVKPLVRGIHVVTPFGRIETALDVIRP
jgi:homocysteine S-methyltransferase